MAIAASVYMKNEHMTAFLNDSNTQPPLEYNKMAWWQKLQYQCSCCILDWMVHCFCQKSKLYCIATRNNILIFFFEIFFPLYFYHLAIDHVIKCHICLVFPLVYPYFFLSSTKGLSISRVIIFCYGLISQHNP